MITRLKRAHFHKRNQRKVCNRYATQTATAVIDNKGDLGAALKDLGSKENVRNLLVAIATAGVLDQLGQTFKLPSGQALTNADFATKLQTYLINGVASSMVQTAINGGNLEDALKNAIKTGIINATGAQIANGIGDLKADQTLNDFTGALAHAILGCAMGSATAGKATGSGGGCAAGAGGAVVGELSAEWYGNTFGGDPKAAADFAKLTTALVASAGGVNAMNIAGITSNNAVVNNYLDHRKPNAAALSEKEQYDRAKAECGTGTNPQACETQTRLANLSAQRDLALRNACSGSTANVDQCNALSKDAYAMGNNVYGNFGGLVFANSPDTGFGLNVSTVGAPSVNTTIANSWHNQAAHSTSQGLILLPGPMVGATKVPAALLSAEITATNAASVASAHATVIGQAVRAGVQTEAQLWAFVANTYGAPAATAMMAASANPEFVINVIDFGVGAFDLDPNPPTTLGGYLGWAVYNTFKDKR